ncbi:helix-turn-helix domain-containing protein [Cupriavidus pauculus]|uniref:helix-turn-helix domain-containing protein n=1 Tax=Cupriavidus pauculus TaxID=82633 RepID=UPI0012483453|nr:helix-turn-helix domain-containing protein [Cupriavidus pauculus]KAB0595503.1 hypothetical protein F7R19_28565 [Cupriavidus pauculus]MCM3608901.1 hypothetical protein [Cupriavidus pauculus]UAL00372.1 hypothetical protein K8O84_03055 [Cupriavidus pauculus]
MKNARPYEAETSANEQPDSTTGRLPSRTNTVRAEVLAHLIEGRRLTNMDSVFAQNTTRLAAVVHALESDYGWQIKRRDIEKCTVDGRTASVSEYWLSEQTRRTALATGARAWVNAVTTERAKQREAAQTPH